MVKVYSILWGEEFSPKKIKQDGIKIDDFNEPGDIGKIGRYKNQKIPYGSCTIYAPDNEEQKIEWLANYIYDNRLLFKNSGVTDIDFSILWEGLQGNMFLTAKELKSLAKLDIDISITYQYLD